MDILASSIMFFLLMDPLGNLPFFISIIDKVNPKRRKIILIRELLIALFIMLLFFFTGQSILNIMGLKQSAVSISGGIILFIMALKMIFPNQNDGEDYGEQTEPFIVPMATPFVAGPSLLAAIILFAHKNHDQYLKSLISIFIAWGVSSLILLSSGYLVNYLNKRALIAIERLMGMILVMLAVQMFLDGTMLFLLKN